jgi:hypothetical protein
LAISGIRFITPLLVAVLVYIGSQANITLTKLVDTVQQIQVTMATEQAVRVAESVETRKALADHEIRIRDIERKRNNQQ